MKVSKQELLEALYESSSDKALRVFYDNFGATVRSEYSLDGKDVVDLDWESSGVIITLIDSKVDQIRLTAYDSQDKGFKGWMGDGVTLGLSQEELIELYGDSSSFSYDKDDYHIEFEFKNGHLEYVNLSKIK